MMATVVFVTNFHLTGKRGGDETGPSPVMVRRRETFTRGGPSQGSGGRSASSEGDRRQLDEIDLTN